ncbi:DUF2911 domain-containing protein [Chitinophaga niabensis]|uniref:DUF2911 domain-containing protein n=1 Tax=Chitinophaga niabensis TaxID=536979 RepID=A0A1N6E853_9BACT|nr:DUF2911 domain-containing protein [Chitinophaga niabensis]SIN79219.1 Protein of unknown function [Chitinophaga niabensis]
MKQFLSAVAVCLVAASASMAQGIKMPAPSPTQTIKQQFALSAVEVTYSRPLAKGRTVMGDLVPYDKLWRTGANNATKITFGEDVKLNGQPVAAGEYALYTVPSRNGWEIVLNKGLKNWGVDGYKKEEDVLRFQTESHDLPFNVESFMISFENVRPTAMTMMLLWEKTMVPIEITADIDGKVMAQIDNAMKTAEKKPYFSAAMYYYESGKDLKQALTWADMATKEDAKAFWVFHLKAKIQARLGDKAGAKATAQQSIELAKAANNADYVALNEKLIAGL